MKAWVLQDINKLKWETAEKPAPKEQEVLVEIKAAGICGSDIPRIYRTGAYSYPLIPGHEFSGVVVQAGSAEHEKWLGQSVGIFPLIPCMKCGPCRKKQYEMCRHYSYLGSRRDGGFAEYVAVPADNLLLLPKPVTFEEAAMMEPMAVAVHAMRRILSDSDDRNCPIAVWGLGTIGLLLVMFLKEAGFQNLLTIGNKEFQRQAVRQLGLPDDCYIDGRKQDAGQKLMERTEGLGAEVFFECVGKNETLLHVVENTAPGGRICLVGNPASDMSLPKESYWKILRRQMTITGTWNSSFTHEEEDDWHYVADRLARKAVAPDRLISHRFPLEELDKGLEIMRDKTEDYGKIMGIREK